MSLFFGILLQLSLTWAWNCNSHMLTALIAERELSASTLSLVNELLAPMNGALTHNVGDSFVEAACWADDIETYGLDAFNTWHVIEKPYNYAGFVNATGSNVNLLWSIDQCLTALASSDTSASLLENSMNIRFLIHFIGDIHQLLHVTNFWSEQFPYGDHLGTLYPVDFNGDIKTLHELWDSGVGVLAKEIDRPLSKEGKATLNTWADWITGNYTRSTLAPILAQNTTMEWSDATYHAAVKYAYTGISPGATPTNEYLNQGWQVTMQQLALSGYRLADLLKQLYGHSLVTE